MKQSALRTLAVVCCVACAGMVLAQNPTGTLNGHVTYENEPLPGVTVTVTSPALQGSRTAITGGNGDYTLKFLPPGDYRVMFTLDSFRTLEQNVKIVVAQTKQIDAVMYPEAVAEEIVVTSNYETISAAAQSSTTLEQSVVESLPVDRDLNNAVLLAPGTTQNAPRGGITIAGSQSHENLFLVNGVVVNENIRGQAFDLFIEDAIEETTTSVSGISAEYGRFSGGVVNMITKSGGNDFSGSLRVNVENDDWIARTPLSDTRIDDRNETYEATLGGYVLKDRLWFFLAGRDKEESLTAPYFTPSLGQYVEGENQQRYEAKLTFSPHASHRVLGSYIEIDTEQTNYAFDPPVETSVIDPVRNLPQSLLALNYTGVLTDSFFLEGQYSEREFTFEGSGGEAVGDLARGTNIYFPVVGAEAGAPSFCGACGDEERDNENLLVKASYFYSSERLGTHDVVLGYDSFSDIRLNNNYQSASDWVIWNFSLTSSADAEQYTVNGELYPVFSPGEWMVWFPIFDLSEGTDFTTDALYVNDTWRATDKLTLSLGLRYEANDGVDSSGATIADDSRISPRLGATFDVLGDGTWIVNASYGRYVTALANGVANTGGGGSPSIFVYTYGGPFVNLDSNGNFVPMYTSEEALAQVFDWFEGVGGVGNTDIWTFAPSISGFSDVVRDLKSPYSEEISVGLTRRLGSKGMVRADYVHRQYHDFYATRRDLTTGQISGTVQLTPDVSVSEDFDLGVVVNEDDLLRREYDGLHTQVSYRFSERLQAGGNWTWSHARGNWNGETTNSGPITSGILEYPEYLEPDWFAPMGDLAIDQRHKVRAWLVWDAISTSRHNLTVSWLENFWTGQPYGGFLRQVVVVDDVANPGYLTPPSTQPYWVTPRDAFRTDDIHRSDLALNYSFFVNVLGTDLELFVQPEVLNVFNEQGVIDVNNTIVPTGPVNSFNPFTDEPVQGEDWDFGSSFGQPQDEDDYQVPRTFRLSVGIRF